eukprot:TRINITY_DN9823_c0_g6_i1.p1 TRINITY_DN9823_c0_g6~~TRINITY_DN9823_c0_g6_i1.p1  ORF type:complete len:464 (-),score=45.97 TRINITY_DN9823_c0_g6_i1:420-1811(-)
MVAFFAARPSLTLLFRVFTHLEKAHVDAKSGWYFKGWPTHAGPFYSSQYRMQGLLHSFLYQSNASKLMAAQVDPCVWNSMKTCPCGLSGAMSMRVMHHKKCQGHGEEPPLVTQAKLLWTLRWRYILTALALLVILLAAVRFGPGRDLVADHGDILLSFLGLCSAFVCYGVVQEYIMTQTYAGGKIPTAALLVFVNRLLAMPVGLCMLWWKGESIWTVGSMWCSLPALTQVIGSTSQHWSLRFISFPTQVLFKSGKIVPTMAVGSICMGRKYTLRQYSAAFVITACVIGFFLGMEWSSSSTSHTEKAIGVGLLFLFLLSDALTSNQEAAIFKKNQHLTEAHMFIAMTIFSLPFSAILICLSVNLAKLWSFLESSPTALLHCCYLSVFAAAGQQMTLHIVRRHGAYALSIMMTVRQMMSLILSAWFFGHHISTQSLCCAVGVFVVILMSGRQDRRSETQKEARQS